MVRIGLFCFLFHSAVAQNDIMLLYRDAMALMVKKNFEHAEQKLRILDSLMPDDTEIYFLRAQVLAQMGDHTKAMGLLKASLIMGSDMLFAIGKDSAFVGLWADSEFQNLLKEIEQLKRPVHHSRDAYLLTERDLIPEGTAYDGHTGQLFISSTYKRKIKRIYPDGRSDDFTKEGQDGLLGVVGMEVDSVRRILWVNSCNNPNMPIRDSHADARVPARVHKFDLTTGRLLQRYDAPAGSHFFNDLTVTAKGDVFITDTESGEIWQIAAERHTLEIFLKLQNVLFLNGITKSPDDQWLYVAHVAGILVIDIATRRYEPLKHPPLFPLGSIDGLAFYKQSLIAHQSGVVGRIKRIYLDNDLRTATHAAVLEAHNPHFDQPTTGEIGGSFYYYIANAQLRSGFRNKKIKPYHELRDVVILKIPLE
ncbi:MAG TPA: hypothetical protein PKU71_14165 [bacterium]|nr:hypothetical protein [bacterium]